MTIIQALKKIKQLGRKIDNTKNRIARWCSYFDNQEPVYNNIEGMIQSVRDMMTATMDLKHKIHKTNILTKVEWNNKMYTMDELLLLRTVGLPAELNVWKSLRRKEHDRYAYNQGEPVPKVVLQYDPRERDKHIDAIEEEMARLDDFLDELNIKTELVD